MPTDSSDLHHDLPAVRQFVHAAPLRSEPIDLKWSRGTSESVVRVLARNSPSPSLVRIGRVADGDGDVCCAHVHFPREHARLAYDGSCSARPWDHYCHSPGVSPPAPTTPEWRRRRTSAPSQQLCERVADAHQPRPGSGAGVDGVEPIAVEQVAVRDAPRESGPGSARRCRPVCAPRMLRDPH